ncbi:MAG: MlaD family protein [Rubrivivax sp.]
MTPRPNAARIGLFAIGGIVLLVGAVALLVGGRLFAETERAVMFFGTSVQGLREGAAVVLRGVRLGSVRSIDLVSQGGDFRIPVVVEIDSSLIRKAAGHGGDDVQVRSLVQRGLTARLATQSLLTGTQYIDLDLRGAAAAPSASAASAGAPVPAAYAGLPQIPTEPPLMQALQAQLEAIDIPGLLNEARATLAAARKLADGPEVRNTMAELSKAATSLSRLSGTLERRAPRLADNAQTALARAGDAAARVGGAADRLGAAAGRADDLLQPDSATLASVRKAADELAQSASALRQVSAGDTPTVLQLQQTLADVGRAARSIRQLADLIDDQPASLLRGRPDQR